MEDGRWKMEEKRRKKKEGRVDSKQQTVDRLPEKPVVGLTVD
ncbi:hypothetical protein [Tychonema sp. LEGE 07203]|nr:hypothetical protein [Tychonema sp. LEGE 07203]